jgi:ABC-type transport system substrate-binding protein
MRLSILIVIGTLTVNHILYSQGTDLPLDLKVAIPNPIVHTSPEKVTLAQERFIIPLIYDGLFTLDEDGAIAPDLAKSWTFDPKLKVLAVVVDNRRFFSDGTPVTVEDIADTFQMLCAKKSRIRDLLEDLEGCTDLPNPKPKITTDRSKNAISFQLKFQPTSFLHRIASQPVLIFKKSQQGNAIGSGPYQVESQTHDQLTIVPNPWLKKPSKIAKHSRITLAYKEEALLDKYLSEGKFDVAAMYLSSTGERITDSKYSKYYHAPTVTQSLILNPSFPAFSSKNIRQRIRDGIHKAKISVCSPGSYEAKGFIPPGIGGNIGLHGGELKTPAKAKVEATKHKVAIYEHKDRKSQCKEDIIVKAMREVNIDAQYEYDPSYKEMEPRRGSPITPAYVELFVFPSRDAGTVLRRFLPGTNEPYFFYTKQNYQDLLHQAMNRPNLTDRFEVYRSIDQDIVDESIVIPLFYVGHVNFMKSCLQIKEKQAGIFVSPNSFSYLEKIERRKNCK